MSFLYLAKKTELIIMHFFPDDIVCFTDGSRHQLHGCTGASVYNQTESVEKIILLGKHSTIFQAEVCAILTCVQSLRTQQNQSIVICFDSQAALKALQSPKITSSLVADTVAKLQELSVFNSVRLLWVPGHFGVKGNKKANAVAKRAAHSEFLSPEPAIGIPATTVCNEAQQWATKEHFKSWRTIPF